MPFVLTKEFFKKLEGIKGECRGMHFRNDKDFILARKGEAGLKAVEEKLGQVGCPLRYKEIKDLDFYPAGWRAASLLAIKEVFGWGEGEIKELCSFASAVSLVVRIYMKFFYSLEKVLKQAPKMWREYFTEGRLVVKNYNKKKKEIVLEIRDFSLDPVFCRCMEGYLQNIAKMITNSPKTECREEKCVFKGGDCHQFKIIWQ